VTGNTWAVITGASSGIGKALALEFAARGYHVFLTGRNEVALRAVASEARRASSMRLRTRESSVQTRADASA